MAQDTAVESRVFSASDQARQQQQQLFQRQIQQQRLEHQVQQHQLHQHLQRQQQQYQLQQQFQQQWSPQLHPTCYPSYSYPLPSAVSAPPLQPAVNYARPSVAGTSTAAPVQPGVQGGSVSSPPALSLRDILHILGESVAVLECLRVLLLQLLQWGAEVGALLRASSFLQYLARFCGSAGASAFRRFKGGLFSLSFRSVARKQQSQQQPLQQARPQEEQSALPQEREPLLQQAWQLVVSPVTNFLSAAPTQNEFGEHGSHAHKQESAFSVFSKTAAAAGTVVATSTAAARRSGGLLKLLPGRLGALVYGVLVLGVFYRLYLQWRKYRRLLRRYRRLVTRMSAQREKRSERAVEASALLAGDLESCTTHKSTIHEEGEEEARAWEMINRPPGISTRADTLETVSGPGSHHVLQRDASVQTEHLGAELPLNRQQEQQQQQPSKPTCLLTDGATPLYCGQQQLEDVERAAFGYSCTIAAPLWTPTAATPPPFHTDISTAFLPKHKEDFPAASADCCQRATLTAELLTTERSRPEAESDLRFHTPSQEGSYASLKCTGHLEKAVGATQRRATPAAAQPSLQTATALPSPVVTAPAVGPLGSPGTLVETSSPGTAVGFAVNSVGRVVAAADSTMSGPAVNERRRLETAEDSLQCERGGNKGELLLRQFLQARAERVRDPSKGGLLTTSLEKFASACATAGDAAPMEIVTGAKCTAKAVGDFRRNTIERIFPGKGEGEAKEGQAARGAGAATTDKARYHAQAAAACGSAGYTSAGELSRFTPNLRQRAASWADGVTPQASNRLIDASRKALAALAATRVVRSENHIDPDEPVVRHSVVEKIGSFSDASRSTVAPTVTRELSPSNPLISCTSGVSTTCAAKVVPSHGSTVTAPEGARETRDHPSSKLAPAGPPAWPVRPDVGGAASPGALTISSAAAAAANSTAGDAAQAAVKDFVEEQLRCYKAAEKRATPSFQDNPFLRLSRLQREREQQEKYRQQLLEREFTRTDIPPWERGSNLENKDGEKSMDTSYWKGLCFSQSVVPSRATPWSAAPSLLVPPVCGELLQGTPSSPKLQQEEPEHQAAQQNVKFQRTLQQSEKNDTVLRQQQERWLPAYLSHPPADSATSNGADPPSAAPSPPVPAHSQMLLHTQPYPRTTESFMDAQKGMLRSSTPTCSRAPPVADAVVASGIPPAWPQPAKLPLSSQRPIASQAKGTNRRSCTKDGRRSNSAMREGDAVGQGEAAELAATDTEAGAGPTATTVTATQKVPIGHKNRAPVTVRNLSLKGVPHIADERQGGSSQCLRAALDSSRPAQRRSQTSVADAGTGTGTGAGEPVDLSDEHFVAPAADVATSILTLSTEGGKSPPALRASAFADTALVVRLQQQKQLRQMLRTQSVHQQSQEQPRQQRTEKEMRLQAQHQVHHSSLPEQEQQGDKDADKNSTLSTASDADWLAELGAAAARDEPTGRYYYPELYA